MCIVEQHTGTGGDSPVKIVISNTSDTPLYQQIKDQIKDAILKEELVEGDPLPSIRAFANPKWKWIPFLPTAPLRMTCL